MIAVRVRLVLVCAISGTALHVASASAQQSPAATAAAEDLKEVVVTARKRAETLQSVPVSISAFSDAQIQEAGYRDLADISSVAPGFYYHEQGGQFPGRYNSAIRFRGMDTNQIAPSQQLGTVFLDGVYVSGAFSSIGLDNIQRIEVIKGPQSAQFGRGTFGGAVNIVTRTPSFEPRTILTADLAQFGTHELIASHEDSLIQDKLAYRISIRGYGTDGQYRSATDGGRLGSERTNSGELVLFARPVEHFDAKLRVMYSEDSDGAPAGIFLGGAKSRRGAGPDLHNCFALHPEYVASGVSNYFCGHVPTVDLGQFLDSNTALDPSLLALFRNPSVTESFGKKTYRVTTGVPVIDHVGLERNILRAGLILNYEIAAGSLEGHTVSAIGGYNRLAANWVRDFDQSGANNWFSQDPQLFRDASAELRLTSPGDQRVRYSAGLSYFDGTYASDFSGGKIVWNIDGKLSFPPYTPGQVIYIGGNTPIEGAKTSAVFGSISVDIVPQLTLDLEGRYQRDKISQEIPADPNPRLYFEAEIKTFLPRGTLSFRPTDQTTLWTTYSEGNIPGFFNGFAAQLSPKELAQLQQQAGVVSVFNKEETLKNYEIGWRQQLLDRRLSFALAAYRLDWKNQKTRRPVTIIKDNGLPVLANVQTNAGGSKLSGVEFEGTAQATEHLQFNASLTRAKGHYTSFTCGFAPYYPAPGKDCTGKTPPRFPDWSGDLAATWNAPFNETWGYFIRADARYQGKSYCDEPNFASIKGFTTTNLRAGFQKTGTRVEAYVRNALNDDNYTACARWSDYSTTAFSGNGPNQGVALTPPDKRTVGMRVIFDF